MKKSLDLEYMKKALNVKTGVRAGKPEPPPRPIPLYHVPLYAVPLYAIDI